MGVETVFLQAESYLELSRASMMELFCENSQGLLAIFAKNFIIDLWLGSKYASEKTETFKMRLTKIGQFILIVITRSVSCIFWKSKCKEFILADTNYNLLWVWQPKWIVSWQKSHQACVQVSKSTYLITNQYLELT